MGKKELNKDELERIDSGVQPEREDPIDAQKTDIDFSLEEQKNIVQMVIEDLRVGIQAQQNWKSQKEKDLQQIFVDPPSKIEGLKKLPWQSDRNLGIVPGVLDIYQATLLATCWNPDSIHFRATEENDVDNRDNSEKFMKWAVGPREMNTEVEVDDFINNKVSLGFSLFKIEWEVKYEWVDKRIPVYSKTGNKNRVVRFDIKLEKRRFERARIRNVDDLDKIYLPSYGKNIQEMPFVIEIIPVMLTDIPELTTRKMILDKFKVKNEEVGKSKNLISHQLGNAPQMAANQDGLQALKSAYEGIQQTVDNEGRDFPLDVIEWYGYITRKGKREKYRVWIELSTETFIAGKSLRKIRRDGRFPYVGGPLRRVPGQLRGGSLTQLISPLSNALNNNYNQTSDFQTITNLPFGFANFEEGFTQNVLEIEPGKIYKAEKPSENIYFPNLQRSLAWSYQDKQFILEMIERLTGAASYFLTSASKDGTATRDNIVEQKGETKFGLWVRRIQNEISEALNMAFLLYQDWAPPGLGRRVLGEKDGKQIIRNLSIDSLRGNMDAYMVPDLSSGSKVYERQVALWGYRELQMSPWFNPQINPRGNWLLTKEAMLKQGYGNPEYYMPPQPKMDSHEDEEANAEWERFKQGEVFDPPEGITPAVVRHYMTHLKQKETMYQDLDEEYRANFDAHFFKTFVNYQEFMQQVNRQQMEMMIAYRATQALKSAGMGPQMQQQDLPEGNKNNAQPSIS